jgi:hypothetical protein
MEEFDVEKLKRSLTRPGASPDVIEKIVTYVQKNLSQFKTTEDIFRFALEQLKEKEPHIATRYNLKRALLEFGPTGYPFEKYIALILDAQGYATETNLIIKGWCVDHEIDIVAQKDHESFMVECKFHNELSYRTHVQVPLYTEARFHDIEKTWKPDDPQHSLMHTWIFTNTSFTYEAIKYSNCIGIRLTSWDYPKDDNLAQLIVKLDLYPVTAIASLSKKRRYLLVKNGFFLARDVEKNIDLLKKSGMNNAEIEALIKECTLLCGK